MVSDAAWEIFDSLCKTLHRQGRRVEELETRVAALEARLRDRAAFARGEHPLPRIVETEEIESRPVPRTEHGEFCAMRDPYRGHLCDCGLASYAEQVK